MGRTFNFDSLGPWPTDTIGQQTWVSRMRAMLADMEQYFTGVAPVVVQLDQSVEPSQAEWETAYMAQTGQNLPIPPTADLVWYDSSQSRVAGHYRTIEGSSTVWRREHSWPRGATVVLESASFGTARSITYYIKENPTLFPLVTVILPTACDLILTAVFAATLVSGTGFLGVDFLMNGVKVGDVYYATASDQGIVNISTSQLVVCEAVIRNLPAGTYYIQMVIGITNSPAAPPTYSIGGVSGGSANGVYQLTARGIAL